MVICPMEEQEIKEDMDLHCLCCGLETMDGKKRDHLPTKGTEFCRSLPFNQVKSGCLDKGAERTGALQSGGHCKKLFINP